MAEGPEMSRTIAHSRSSEFTNVASRSRRRSKSLFCAELTHHFCWVAVLAVDGFVHGAHVVCGDSSGESVESNARSRGQRREGFIAHQRDSLVGREVVAVVFESDQVEAWIGPSVELAAIMSTWWAVSAR